jgi:hypothetical protein
MQWRPAMIVLDVDVCTSSDKPHDSLVIPSSACREQLWGLLPEEFFNRISAAFATMLLLAVMIALGFVARFAGSIGRLVALYVHLFGPAPRAAVSAEC